MVLMNKDVSSKGSMISSSVTLAIAAIAKKMKADGIKVIDFSAGEPDFNTPSNICAAAIKAIEAGKTRYTAAAGLPELRQAICKKLHVDNKLDYEPENIVVSNGAKHSLYNAMQAICNPGDEVLLSVPYWVSYPEIIKLADAVPVFVETKEAEGFKYTENKLRSRITPKTKAIIINSPNNPTGMVYSAAELKLIANIAEEYSLYVISDEIYEKLIYDGIHISIASLGERIKDLTIVVNGMSKCYAMTGWRIGYAAANRKIAKIMANIQSHATSNPNTIAQYGSIEALNGNQDSIHEMWKTFRERRNYMIEKINAIPVLSCQKPMGAFYVMVNISRTIGKEYEGISINNSLDFAEFLLRKANIAVVPGSGFGAENYVRLSYATSIEDIKEGLRRIGEILKLDSTQR
jgi:aspartate aminotransferase